MVWTRSQKRDCDDSDDINLKTKKRKIDNDDDDSTDELYEESLEEEVEEVEEEVEEVEEEVEEIPEEVKNDLENLQNIFKKSIKKIFKKLKDDNFEDSELESDDVYTQFNDQIYSVYEGEFFEREPIDERKKYIKDNFTEDQIKEMSLELRGIQDNYKNNSPNIIDILKMNVNMDQKQKLLEKLYWFRNSEILTPNYNSTLKFLNANISNNDDPELLALEEKILKSSLNKSDSYRMKILKSPMSFENKVIAYKKLEIMETYEDTDTSEYAKYKSWMDTLLSIPFGIYNDSGITINSDINDIKHYIKNVRDTLDNKLSFLEKPKDQIINIVTQMVRNPDVNINAIGLCGSAGTGKCFDKDTPILMFDGTIKMVQDIQVGEILMGDDSTQRTVLALGNGRDTMYKVTNVKGESYVVNSEHILCLKYSNSKRINNDKKSKRFRVNWFNHKDIKINIKDFYYNKKDKNVILEEANRFLNDLKEEQICDIPIKKYLKLSKSMKNSLKGYSVSIEFEEKELDFDPYIIGLWLGDGSHDGTRITNQDSTIIHYLKNNLQKYNCYLQYQNTEYGYRINGNGSNTTLSNCFFNTLRKYDLIKNKHIPHIYKCNSRENRLKLLAGLLDSDGHLLKCKAGYEFSQGLEHEQIIDDIIYLCRSLGFACYKNKKQTTWTHKGIKNHGEAWRICISGKGIENIPVLCPRKKANPRQQIKDVLVSGIKVEELPEDNYYGFMIDGNNRFLLGNFIVTHNSSICESIAKALGRPFRMISLGGESDASILTGHGFTYVGSSPGRFIDILIDSKTMNPVVLIDELDKIGETHHGKEIIGTLIHLTDSTTNNHFNLDKYFSGIEFDLSKVVFVFTYNDPNKIDKILADRLIKINVDDYNYKEKLEITNKHIVTYLLEKFNFNLTDISFSQDAIEYIIKETHKNGGMRDIKTKIKIILSRINNLLLTNEEDDIIKLKYKKLYSYYKSLPVTILKEHVDILLEDSITNNKNNNAPEHMYM